jgi:hypothetical protein
VPRLRLEETELTLDSWMNESKVEEIKIPRIKKIKKRSSEIDANFDIADIDENVSCWMTKDGPMNDEQLDQELSKYDIKKNHKISVNLYQCPHTHLFFSFEINLGMYNVFEIRHEKDRLCDTLFLRCRKCGFNSARKLGGNFFCAEFYEEKIIEWRDSLPTVSQEITIEQIDNLCWECREELNSKT